MPRFFFDYIDDHDGFDPDDEGIEFLSIEAAYIDAYHSAIDMWAEARHEGRNLSHHRFLIRDENGQVLLELSFAKVLGVMTSESR